MTEVGEGTLEVTYNGSEISINLIGKSIAAALDDVSKRQAQTKEAQPENTEQQEYTYSSVNNRPDVKEVASKFRGYGVDFAVLKNPLTNDCPLLFRANNSETIDTSVNSKRRTFIY